MSKNSFPVYVFTSDHHMYALRAFAYLFNKYWSHNQRVIVGGFSYPNFQLPPNFQFYSIGKMEDYPVKKWSNAVIEFLNHFRDPYFCFMLEDYWLIKPVYLHAIEMLHDYMRQFKYVIKMDLGTDRRYAKDAEEYGTCGHLPLLKSHPDSPYHMSLMCGLWNRENMLKVLIPDESPWDVEITGTTRLAKFRDELIVIGTKSWDEKHDRLCPLHHTLALRGGESSKLLLDELTMEDVSELKQRGFIE